MTPAEWTSSKDRFRDELLTDRRNRFFRAYMVKAKQKMKIEVNREALQRAASANGTTTKTRRHEDARRRPSMSSSCAFVPSCLRGPRYLHRTNVNGISASGSPRRNIANGPRIDAQRLELAARQVRASATR